MAKLTKAELSMLRRAAEPGVERVRGNAFLRQRLARLGYVTEVRDAADGEWARITDAGRLALASVQGE